MGSDELARGACDAERVRDDVLNELVSREAAERDYGVVLTADGAVDVEATRRRRSRAGVRPSSSDNSSLGCNHRRP